MSKLENSNAKFLVDKSLLKMPTLTSFKKKPTACNQKVLLDRSILKMENAKIQKFKCDILSGQKLIENAQNGQF